MKLMIIRIIGIVFVKGFENKIKSEPIPITQNQISQNPIIKSSDIKVSSSYMKIKKNKYSY
jgi:hypothetical protein